MNLRVLASAACAAAALAACTGGGGGYGSSMYVAPSVPQQVQAQQAASLGTATFTTASRGAQSGFAASNGVAVYVFDLDLTTPGTSACVASCLAFWIPIAPENGVAPVAPFSTLRRPDGTKQLAYDGHPLYTYTGDTNITAAAGDGFNFSGGLWHLASPDSLSD